MNGIEPPSPIETAGLPKAAREASSSARSSQGAKAGAFQPEAAASGENETRPVQRLETLEGVGIGVPAGSRIVMQIHYHPLGDVADVDVTGIDARWQDTEPEHSAVLALVGNAESEGDGLLPGPNDDVVEEFRIPAGATGHTETMEFSIEQARAKYQVFMAGTHMHYVGTDMAIWVDPKKPDDDEPEPECLVQTPKWDFDWQRGYDYDAPLADVPRIRGGDTIRTSRPREDALTPRLPPRAVGSGTSRHSTARGRLGLGDPRDERVRRRAE